MLVDRILNLLNRLAHYTRPLSFSWGMYHRIQGTSFLCIRLGYRAWHATTNTAVELIQKVVELGAASGDRDGFANLIRGQRVFNELLKLDDSSNLKWSRPT